MHHQDTHIYGKTARYMCRVTDERDLYIGGKRPIQRPIRNTPSKEDFLGHTP